MFGKRCPVCGGKMIEVKDDVDREYYRCTQCGVQIPKKMLEVKHENL